MPVSESPDEFLRRNSGGSGYPDFTFDTVGGGIAGIVDSPPRVAETQYGRRLIVELVDKDGQGHTVWIKEGLMAQAVAKAVADVGAETLAEGGTLAIVFSDERDTGKGNPLKIFEARYTPPARGVAVDDIFANLDT